MTTSTVEDSNMAHGTLVSLAIAELMRIDNQFPDNTTKAVKMVAAKEVLQKTIANYPEGTFDRIGLDLDQMAAEVIAKL